MTSDPTRTPSASTDTDSLVVKRISEAEMMVCIGQADQAISMLKDLLKNRPGDVHVRLKLKDIYLRCEMPADAAEQYFQLARIYEERGDEERAKSYVLRAKRLSSSPDSLPASPPARALTPGEPAPDESLLKNSASKASGEISKPDLESSAANQPVAATAPQAPPLQPQVEVQNKQPLTDQAGPSSRKPGASEKLMTALPARPAAATGKQFIPAPPLPARSVINDHEQAAQGTFLNSSQSQLANNRSRYKVWVAAVCLVMVAAVVFIAMRTFNKTQGKREQAELSVAATPDPQQPPSPATGEEASPVEQAMTAEPSEGFTMNVPAAQPPNQPRTEEQPRTIERQQEVAETSQPAVPVSMQPPLESRSRTQPPPAILPIGPEGNNYKGLPGATGKIPESGSVPEPPPPPQTSRRTGELIPPRVLSRVEPSYPALAKQAGVTGAVTIEISIDEQGRVVRAQALSGPQLLRGVAVMAAQRWKFQPSTLDGAAVKSSSRIVFNFK